LQKSNRRRAKRLKIDRSVKIPVQLFPVLPFIGHAVEASLVNISSGGMALLLQEPDAFKKLKKGTPIKLHFHLPGRHLQQCRAKLTHKLDSDPHQVLLGLKFFKPPAGLIKALSRMAQDEANCERRIQEAERPWCDIRCTFHNLCRKPTRILPHTPNQNHIEIALQSIED
jgi:c-di-GMP-binding flagellar brake protein YcgR